MSQARLYPVKKTRKEFTCSKCREVIPVGSACISFAVGFRGYEQRRHDTAACRPTRGERESSMVGQVYDAQDSFDLTGCDTLESITEQVEAVAEAAREVASEYESNEMYDINEDLQGRASTLNDAADTLDSWNDSLDEEPEVPENQPDEEEDPEGYAEWEEAADAHTTWLEEAVAAAEAAVSEMELP